MSDHRKGQRSEIDREAAAWFGRREIGLSASEEGEFQGWLARSPLHREQYRQLSETWRLLDGLKERRTAGDSHAYPLVSHSRGRATWMPWVLAMAAAVVLGFVIWSRPAVTPAESGIATGPDGMKRIELPDGSVVQLNADSRVEVDVGPEHRRVVLQKGEAFFSVAPDPARPFVVTVAGVTVRAVGTAFNIVLRASDVEVLVTEGKVRVEEPAGRSLLAEHQPDQPHPLLEAGQKAVLALDATAPRRATVVGVHQVEAEKALAWQVRMLEFDAQPLSEVVATFNRYNHHQLYIADPKLATRRFGGTFRADNYDALLELLESRFGIVAERDGDRILLRAAR